MEIDKQIFDSLSEKQQAEVLKLLKEQRAIECRDNYYEFFKEAWKIIEPAQPLVEAPHIKYLCDKLDEWTKIIEKGDKLPFKEAIINVPPASSKSSIVTKVYPVWAWTRKPSFKIITSSYDDKLVTDHTTKSRDILASDWFQDWYGHLFELKRDQNEKKRYYNNKTGIRLGVTTQGGGKTGFHCHIFIEDDPLDPHQASRDINRAKAIHNREKVIPSRLIDGGLRITVMQRLHQNDPTGYALHKYKDDIFHICLPAEFTKGIKPEEAKDLYVDGLLDPNRLSPSELDKYREALEITEYTGQYLQSPFIDGGGEIKEEWFDKLPRRDIPNLTWDLWIDGAYTEKSKNDPTGLMVCAYDKRENKLYIRNFESAYKIMPDLLKYLPTYCNIHEVGKRSRIRIEPKASGKSLKQMIGVIREIPSAIEIKGWIVNEGKKGRITLASPKVEAGRVILVDGSWNEEFIAQLTGYPNHNHDEAVDLIGYAVEHYFNSRRGLKMRKRN